MPAHGQRQPRGLWTLAASRSRRHTARVRPEGVPGASALRATAALGCSALPGSRRRCSLSRARSSFFPLPSRKACKELGAKCLARMSRIESRDTTALPPPPPSHCDWKKAVTLGQVAEEAHAGAGATGLAGETCIWGRSVVRGQD
ncbi:hypothetical protein NN561_017235 [Cricetulus griseus]